MSDSVRRHRRQPTRLHPWDSPGKNTEVGCHFLFQCMKVKRESEAAQWSSTLSDPMDCGPPGSSVHGILQARILAWVAISFSRRSFQPRDQTWVSCIAGGFFTSELSGKPGFYVGRTLIGFRDAQKRNPSCFLCSSPLCFGLVGPQAGHTQLRQGQRSLNWTTWRQWK